MKTPPRLGATCQAPFAGRADKRYGSSRGKRKDFRRQQADQLAEEAFEPAEENEPTEGAPRRSGGGPCATAPLREASARPLRRAPPVPADEDVDAQAPDKTLRHGDDRRQVIGRTLDQPQLRKLPRPYGQGIAQRLAAHDRVLSRSQRRALRHPLDPTLSAYPFLHGRCPLSPAWTQHVTSRYRVQELLEEAWQACKEHFQPVAFYAKKKLRAPLRASLALVDPS